MTKEKAEECRNCKQGYTKEGYAAYPDHIELCQLHAAAPEGHRILSMLADWVNSGAETIIFSDLMADGDDTLREAIKAYSAKAEGGK